MQIPTLALTLAIAWTGAACLAADDEARDPAPTDEASADLSGATTSDTQTGVMCSNKSWRVNFYSDAEMRNEVGHLVCICFRPQTQDGDTTALYVKHMSERTCDIN